MSSEEEYVEPDIDLTAEASIERTKNSFGELEASMESVKADSHMRGFSIRDNERDQSEE